MNSSEERRRQRHEAQRRQRNNKSNQEKKPSENNHSFFNKKNRQKRATNNIDSPNEEQNTPSAMEQTEKFVNKIKAVIKFPRRVVISFVALILLIPIIGIITLVAFSNEDEYVEGNGYATGEYYEIKCTDITVNFADKQNNYEIYKTETYPFEEYIAGVINGEVSEFNNLEVYKEFAIAARSYVASFLAGNNTCIVESSDRFQVFIPNPNSLMRQAANETKEQVLLDADGKLMMTEYDAFCSIAIDDNYYTLKQKNQKIPRNWVDSHSGIRPEWKQGNCTGNHGRGASQWGSYYLATEKGYKYGELLNYYYSTDNNTIRISSSSFDESLVNLNIKSTTNASNTLNQPIATFLSSKGSSLEEYNNYIKNSIDEAGYGTRAGVVAAAVSMINYLYDNFNTKLPYYWGGESDMSYGISRNVGKYNPVRSYSGTPYYYESFDCSGFTSWAVKNAGYNVYRMTVTGFDNLAGSSNMCNITSTSCVGKPGDFISYKQTHIKMIVSVDTENNRYYVAESGGSGVTITTQPMHERGEVETSILHMDDFYNNQNNVNHN